MSTYNLNTLHPQPRKAPPTRPATAAGAELLRNHHQARPTRSPPMWPPGMLVILTRNPTTEAAQPCCPICCPVPVVWRAERLPDPSALQRIRLSATMMTDHFPDRVLGAIQEARGPRPRPGAAQV